MLLQIDELLGPIPGDNPGGLELRYDQVYNQIRQARVEEEELPTGGWDRARKTADYGLVIKLAREVLAKRSKDLQLAVWLAEALLKREGFAGLSVGLQLIQRLLEDYWDHLYPELEDGDAEMRAAPLEWLGQYLDRGARLVPITEAGFDMSAYRTSRSVGYEEDATTYEKRGEREAAIAEGKLTAEEFDQAFDATPKAWYKQLVSDIDLALTAIDELDETSSEKFGADAPSYTALRSAIVEVRNTAVDLLGQKLAKEPDPPEEEVQPEVIEGPSAIVAEPSAPSAAAPAGSAQAGFSVPAIFTPSAGGQVPQGRAAAEQAVGAAARALRADSKADPSAYLLLRGFRWGELRAGGGEIDPLALAAPPTEVRTRLKTLFIEEKWADLLESAEEVMATPFGRGWLDLQRYVLAACDALDGDYANVGSAIRSALRSLLQDLPELTSLTLADDTPTANRETLAWLASEGLLPERSDAVVEEFIPRRARSRIDPYERAKELVRAGKRDAAVEVLMRAAEEERSERGRFLRRTQAGAILVDAGLEAVAFPILEDLSEKIQQHSLEDWEEGETIAHTLGLLYRCTFALEGQSSDAQALYVRVCRLDPMQAMRYAPPSE